MKKYPYIIVQETKWDNFYIKNDVILTMKSDWIVFRRHFFLYIFFLGIYIYSLNNVYKTSFIFLKNVFLRHLLT